MTRFNDLLYETFSPWHSDTIVVCPKCGHAATIHFDEDTWTAHMRCDSCFCDEEIFAGDTDYEVTGTCGMCGRFFRVYLDEIKSYGQKQWVKCPHCGKAQIGDIVERRNNVVISDEELRKGNDPFFHYPLFFEDNFRGHLIWALNREHLQYLIDYIRADIRGTQPDFHSINKTMRSQSDVLPKYMKSAKPRGDIVKVLLKLQQK